jgi:DNA-binding winged helix-turn-helix (wHTH) protein/tetratricopeptide (TPR) repeat protein
VLAETEVKEFPPFRLDPHNQCLWRLDSSADAGRIDLKPKTFDVLRFLVDNPGRLITHDELLEEVWPGADVQQEVVKGHVLAIRKALGDTAEEPRFVLTLRRRGYKFIAAVSCEQASERPPPARLGKFVGRIEPLSQLSEALRKARSASPQLMFVTGEPGIGKTELVERFLQELGHEEDTTVAIGRCIEGYGGIEPHYPVLEALSSLTRQRNGEAVAQALQLVAPTWAVQLPGLLPGQTRASLQQQIAGSSGARMVREFGQLLDKLTERRTLVLVLEDLHWSDNSTVDLLSAFARRRGPARVLMIATYRLGDAAASNHPIHSLSRDLTVNKIATRVILQPLAPAAVMEFVACAVIGAGTQQLAQLLAEQASGNPLLMTATLENFIERGLMIASGDGFRLGVPVAELKIEISSDLSQVLEARIAQLDERQQRALAASSVVGMTFNAATAASASGLPPIEFEEVCETLVRTDKCIVIAALQTNPDGTVVRNYSFKHALYRRALYERQGPIRLAQSHRMIREDLERLYPAAERKMIALQLVQHCAGCAEWTRALDYLREALVVARARFAYRDGLALFNLGSELAGHLPQAERAEIELETLEGCATLYTSTRDPRAFAAYEDLAARASKLGRADVQARALIGMTYVLGWRDNAHCRVLLLEALETSRAQVNPLMRARTELSAHMGLLFLDGWDDSHATACNAALQVLKSGSDKLEAAWALVEHSLLDTVAGRYQAAYRAVREDFRTLIESEVIRAGLHTARMFYNTCLVAPWSLFFLGDLGAAFADLEVSIPLMKESGNDYSARILQLVRGWFRARVGDFQGAHEDCLSALESDGPDESPAPPLDAHEYRIYLVVRGAAEAGLGHFERAHELFEERARLAREMPVSLDWYWRMIAEFETAHLWLSAGKADRAEVHARLLLKLTLESRERTFQALAWDALAEVQLMQDSPRAALESAEHALALAEECETPLASWRAHSTAARTYDRLGHKVEASSSRERSVRASEQLLSTFPEVHPLRELFRKHVMRVRDEAN